MTAGPNDNEDQLYEEVVAELAELTGGDELDELMALAGALAEIAAGEVPEETDEPETSSPAFDRGAVWAAVLEEITPEHGDPDDESSTASPES